MFGKFSQKKYSVVLSEKIVSFGQALKEYGYFFHTLHPPQYDEHKKDIDQVHSEFRKMGWQIVKYRRSAYSLDFLIGLEIPEEVLKK